MKEICTYTLPKVATLQSGPVVVAGAMYFSTDTMTYAIDAGRAPRSGSDRGT